MTSFVEKLRIPVQKFFWGVKKPIPFCDKEEVSGRIADYLEGRLDCIPPMSIGIPPTLASSSQLRHLPTYWDDKDKARTAVEKISGILSLISLQ